MRQTIPTWAASTAEMSLGAGSVTVVTTVAAMAAWITLFGSMAKLRTGAPGSPICNVNAFHAAGETPTHARTAM
eukprot:6602789-Heterocapsa_arctica.AAC.1